MNENNDSGVTLAVAPVHSGFGYAVFENADVIMDWGVKQAHLKRQRDFLEKARMLMHMLQPSVLVIEDVQHESSLRSNKVKALIDKLAALAESKGVTVVRYSRHDMQTVFRRVGVHKKYDIARAVAKLVPELGPRMPRRRREGYSQDFSESIFEAAALALTHFAERK